jgi:hypothetical protein
MAQAIGDILAPAVGVALSPMPIVAVILMLFTPRARTNSLAFSVGWICGILAVVSVVLVLADPAGVSSAEDGRNSAAAILHVILGAGLLALALRQWRTRPTGDDEAEAPRWMTSIDRFTPAMAFGFGAFMSSLNPKNVIFNVAAGGAIAAADVAAGEAVLAVVVYSALASTSTGGLVVWALIAGDSARGRLDAMKNGLIANNTIIMVVLLVILGISQVGKAIGML